MTPDRCCHKCRTPYTCARQHDCDCHVQHAREQRARDTWRDAQEQAMRRAQQASDEKSKQMEGFAPWR